MNIVMGKLINGQVVVGEREGDKIYRVLTIGMMDGTGEAQIFPFYSPFENNPNSFKTSQSFIYYDKLLGEFYNEELKNKYKEALGSVIIPEKQVILG